MSEGRPAITQSSVEAPKPPESEYLAFSFYKLSGRKTWSCDVISKKHDYLLGTIRWYGAWRQYVFYPSERTLYNKGCLLDVAKCLEALNLAQRTG